MVDTLKDILEDGFHLCLAKTFYLWIAAFEVSYPLFAGYTDVEGV
jgi:hypothetical protein